MSISSDFRNTRYATRFVWAEVTGLHYRHLDIDDDALIVLNDYVNESETGVPFCMCVSLFCYYEKYYIVNGRMRLTWAMVARAINSHEMTCTRSHSVKTCKF
jgi:hypothetical protein